MSCQDKQERGATSTEYGLLVGFIGIIIVVGVGLFGTEVDAWYGRMATAVAAVL